MNTGYNCARCGAAMVYGVYIKSKWNTPQPHRCDKCGAVHSVLRGDASVISPAMVPIDVPGVRSPWQLWYTRPITIGHYDCRFVTDIRLKLWWNGRCFQPNEQDTRMVKMRHFQSWRGTWV